MEMEATTDPSRTEIVLPSSSTTPPILRLRLQKKKSPKKVVWSEGTVDNEHMNKKKSKCCCIYKKPLAFGESSSEEEEECEHCFGHPEKKVKTHSSADHDTASDQNDGPTGSNQTDFYECDSGVCTLRNHNDRDQE